MKSLKIYIPFLILFFAGLSISCSNDDNSIKVKNWKILYEQDQTLESVLKKSGWESVSVPLKIKLPYPPVRDFQYVWLKGEFEITDDPANYYGLSTGRVSLADKMYINNKLVGSLPPEKANWILIPRNYVIPIGTLKKGNNVIYIQLGVYHGMKGGGISDEVLVLSEESFNRTQLIHDLIYKRLPFGIVILYIYLVIQLLIFFLWNRDEKPTLYFSILILFTIIFFLMRLPSYKLANFELFVTIALSCGLIISIFLMLGIQALYRIYLSTFNRIIIPLYLLIVLFLLISFNTSYFLRAFYFIQNLYFISIVPILVFLINRLNSINRLNKKKPDIIFRYSAIIVLIVFSLIIVLEAFLLAFRGYFSIHILMFGTSILILLSTVAMAMDSKKRQVELELLYSKLKQNDEKEVLITESSEEKLNRVIDFIKENYTSDLSREGLAAAVEKRPHYR